MGLQLLSSPWGSNCSLHFRRPGAAAGCSAPAAGRGQLCVTHTNCAPRPLPGGGLREVVLTPPFKPSGFKLRFIRFGIRLGPRAHWELSQLAPARSAPRSGPGAATRRSSGQMVERCLGHGPGGPSLGACSRSREPAEELQLGLGLQESIHRWTGSARWVVPQACVRKCPY